jgi:predicted transcriptional regulator
MAVDRLSVTVPSALGAALRALAESRGETVSNIVTRAVERQVRLAALERALAEADREFGPVPPEMIADAEVELLAAQRPKPRKRSRRR